MNGTKNEGRKRTIADLAKKPPPTHRPNIHQPTANPNQQESETKRAGIKNPPKIHRPSKEIRNLKQLILTPTKARRCKN
jgi:hypothetical protein